MLDQILQVLGVGEGKSARRCDTGTDLVHIPAPAPELYPEAIPARAVPASRLPDPVPAQDGRRMGGSDQQRPPDPDVQNALRPDLFVDTSRTHSSPTGHGLALSRCKLPSGGYVPPEGQNPDEIARAYRRRRG